MNEIVSNISNVKYSEIPVGCIFGFLFEDVICVLMKVVYLIITFTLIIFKMCIVRLSCIMLLSLFCTLVHNLRIMAHSSVVLLILNRPNQYLVTQSFLNFFINFCE